MATVTNEENIASVTNTNTLDDTVTDLKEMQENQKIIHHLINAILIYYQMKTERIILVLLH